MKNSFFVGETVGIDTVLSVISDGPAAWGSKYRVRTGCCGAERVYSHASLNGRIRQGRTACEECCKMSRAVKKASKIRSGKAQRKADVIADGVMPGWGAFLVMPKGQAKGAHRKEPRKNR